MGFNNDYDDDNDKPVIVKDHIVIVMSHIPVLLQEVLQYLNARNGAKFIDGTVGDGGYLRAILEWNSVAKVLGIDLDQTALDRLQSSIAQSGLGQRSILAHGNFADLKRIAIERSFYEVDGIILDLGFSSSQLDNPERGFSFQANGPLDMRLDLTATLTAADIVNRYPAERLQKIFKELGEEKFSKRIARRIVDVRKNSKLGTTGQLVNVIVDVLPRNVKYRAGDVARRIFQALRIETNQELENLQKVLPQTLELLKPGGRVVVISFHSLEDRMVKDFFRKAAKGCVCPPEFPECVCGKKSRIKILTKKPIIANKQEQTENPRSKPAKLRAIEKI